MQRTFLAILLPAAVIASLPSCEAVPADESYAFRTDICVLINEAPRPPVMDGDGEPDLQLYPPCTGTTGCTNPTNGYFYQTYYYEDGGYLNVPGECPPQVSDPKVEASSAAAAIDECQEEFGSLCQTLCECFGGYAVMVNGKPQSCVKSTNATTYQCGCSCEFAQ